MPTATAMPSKVRIPTQADLEAALEVSFFDFPSEAITFAWSCERLGEIDELDDEEKLGFEWPERSVTFEDIGRLYCWVQTVRSYIEETEDYLKRLEEALWAMEPFTEEHGSGAFRARVRQEERKGDDA